MGRFVAVVVQFVVFLLTFLVGSLLVHPFHVQTTLAGDATHVRLFQWDGLLLTALLYLLVLVMETSMKRLRTSAVGSTVAVALAVLAGLAMKFGFVSLDR